MHNWMTEDNIRAFAYKIDDWMQMTCKELADEVGDSMLYSLLHRAKSGRMVIRIIEGGNEHMKVGDSKSGEVKAFAVGLPFVIYFPNGHYQSSIVQSIDWENGTFHTMCSTYSFHFLSLVLLR